MNYQLCKEFPAFTPFEIDERAFTDVMALYKDVRKMQIREEKQRKKEEKTKNGVKVIRRPAGDTWF